MEDDKMEKKVGEIYKEVVSTSSGWEVPGYSELSLYSKLADAICRQLKFMRAELQELTSRNVNPVVKAYPLVLFCTIQGGFDRWNDHFAKEPKKQFMPAESRHVQQAIQDFFSGNAQEPPKWISKLCALLAMRAALEESAIDARFKDVQQLRYIKSLFGAFNAIIPFIHSSDIEPILQQFTLTYPLAKHIEYEWGRFQETRTGEAYGTRDLTWSAKNKQKDQ